MGSESGEIENYTSPSISVMLWILLRLGTCTTSHTSSKVCTTTSLHTFFEFSSSRVSAFLTRSFLSLTHVDSTLLLISKSTCIFKTTTTNLSFPSSFDHDETRNSCPLIGRVFGSRRRFLQARNSVPNSCRICAVHLFCGPRIF